MKALVIYGPSASGKSYYAENSAEISQDTEEVETLLLERDYVRFNIMGLGDWTKYHPHHDTENAVDAFWKYCLVKYSIVGTNLIISDTNCKIGDRRKLKKLLEYLGYDVSFHRMSTSLEECIARDAKRGAFRVGADVIKRQWEHFIKDESHV